MKRMLTLALLTAAFGAASAAAQTPQGELSFTFGTVDAPCSVGTGPWTAEEVATFQAQLAVYYPLAKVVYGNPFADATIQICKFYSAGDISGGYSGSTILLEDTRPTALVHEMLHAFHLGRMAIMIFEEGFAEAGSDAVTGLACQTQDCSAGPFAPTRLHHSGMGQVYYEGENVPAMFSPNGRYPPNGTRNNHYRLGGYAWSKVELEHPGFLRDFNQAYFAAFTSNPGIFANVPALAGIARDLAPMVEGMDFDSWFAAQHVFDIEPLPGPGLVQLRDVRSNEFDVVDRYLTAFLWGANLLSLPGQVLEWTLYDNDEQPLATGTGMTDQNGRVVVQFPEGYVGSARLETSGSGALASQFWPVAPEPGGVFGVVPHTGGGTVEVAGLDGWAGPPAIADVSAGYFSVPSLGSVPGRFRLTYRTATGGTAHHVFTKDSSRYFVLLTLPDLVTSPPTAVAARLLPGDRLLVSTTVSNTGDAVSPASQVRFLLSSDLARDGSDLLAGQGTLPALAAGVAVDVTVAASVPPGTAPGLYHVLACANDPEVFAEVSWANDCSASEVEFEVVPSFTATVRSPIRADGTSVFKVNRGALPVKFGLLEGDAPTCALPPATIEVSRVGPQGGDDVPDDLFELPSDVGNQFRISDCQYTYSLAASALGPGRYRTSIRVDGAVVGSAEFSLR